MHLLIPNPILAIVEDDDDLRDNLLDLLQLHGYQAWGVSCAEMLFRELAVRKADMILLDLGLPGENGMSVLKHLQQTRQYLFLIITASLDNTRKEYALANGASAYLVKPIHFDKLLASINDVWMNQCKGELPAAVWRLDTVGLCLIAPNGNQMSLTTHEFSLLLGLMSQSGQPLHKEELMQLLWYQNQPWRDYHAIEVMLSRLRTKALKQLQQALPVQTVHAMGLIFTATAIVK